jgi:hypothetical protein
MYLYLTEAAYLDARVGKHHRNGMRGTVCVYIERHYPQIRMLAFWSVHVLADDANFQSGRHETPNPPDVDYKAVSGAQRRSPRLTPGSSYIHSSHPPLLNR